MHDPQTGEHRFPDGTVFGGFRGTFSDGTVRGKLTSADGLTYSLIIVDVQDILLLKPAALVDLIRLEIDKAFRRLAKGVVHHNVAA